LDPKGVIYPNIKIPQEIPYVKPLQSLSIKGESNGLLTSIQRL